MKKLALFALLVMFVFSVGTLSVAGEKKAKLGPCVRECVQAFNPSLADAGADEFLITDFDAEQCVQYCKEEIVTTETCSYTEDGCCNSYFEETDVDCGSEELNYDAYCEDNSWCTGGLSCVIDMGDSSGTCQLV